MSYEEIRQLKKRKNWSAPGIDGIQNFWWKKFSATWPYLKKFFDSFTIDCSNISDWLTIGRTVLLSKSNKLDCVSDYRPITCLNTVYKIFTGCIASFLKGHALRNCLWDGQQLGTTSDVVGTVDQLLVDECIMQQVKQKHLNLCVTYYDYKKAYDMVRHDWMLRVFNWMGVPKGLIVLLRKIMSVWKIRLEIFRNGQKENSRLISVKKGFLQGDSYSPIGFCLTEVPIALLLSRCKGYKLGFDESGEEVRRTHSYFIDDLKVYAGSRQEQEIMNDIIVNASCDTGALYGVKKCAEIEFVRGKMVKGRGLDVLGERMEALDPECNKFYKFLGCEQANGIDTKKVMERVTSEMNKRMNCLLEASLSEKNLIRAINSYVLPVAGYVMNVCKISETHLVELDMIIKRKLREKKFHARQCSDDRLYLSRKLGGRGLKSLRDMYYQTKTRVACYLSTSNNFWMNFVWDWERSKEHWSVKKEVEEEWRRVGEDLEIMENGMSLNGERLEGDWKVLKDKLLKCMKEKKDLLRIESLASKPMQGKAFANYDENSHHWLNCNIDPKKVSSIIQMQERMVETRAWKLNRNLCVDDKCRLCGTYSESLDHLLSGCEKLAGSDYLKRHNNALLVMVSEWGKDYGLIEKDTKWWELSWEKGKVLENDRAKIVWDFEFKTRKKTRARRPDVILEDKEVKNIFIVDMLCPMECNIEEKRTEKLNKYRQLAFETRERRKGYIVELHPIVIGSLGGGGNGVFKVLRRIFGGREKRTCEILGEMTKVVLWEGESMIRKILSGLIQEEH